VYRCIGSPNSQIFTCSHCCHHLILPKYGEAPIVLFSFVSS
jgi:hypothetical protein